MSYNKVLEDMQAKIAEINGKIEELQKERSVYADVIEAITALKAAEDQRAGRLAVQKGVCPFPESCKERFQCTRDSCNADTCSNGYAYRMS
jgi:hypothetical protein